MLWFLASARAAVPVTVVESGDEFRFSVVVPAPVDEVRAFVRDPRNPASLSTDGRFEIRPRPDGCWDSGFSMSYGLLSIAYDAVLCDTPLGSAARSVESASFRDMIMRWEVQPVAGGTEVAYVYQATLTLPVPSFIARRSTRNSTVATMERLAAHFGGG